MGASLLVFFNKTDIEGCMSSGEIRQVCKQSQSGQWASADTARDYNLTRSRRTNGQLSLAALSQGSIWGKGWIGWSKMPKKDSFCFEKERGPAAEEHGLGGWCSFRLIGYAPCGLP